MLACFILGPAVGAVSGEEDGVGRHHLSGTESVGVSKGLASEMEEGEVALWAELQD